MNLFRLLIGAALTATTLSAEPAPAADPCTAGNDVANAFTCLFEIFPRSGGKGTIGDALAQQAARDGSSGPVKPGGPLVIVNEFGVFDKRELLSNAVGYWMPGELRAKGWDASKVDIPRTHHRVPAGRNRLSAERAADSSMRR